MENYLPLPDLQAELAGPCPPKHLLIEDMEFMAEEMYNYLPKMNFIPDEIKFKMISTFLKDLDQYKKCPTEYQRILDIYNKRKAEEIMKKESRIIPEIITDQRRINQMCEYADMAKMRMLEKGYPIYLRMTIARCIQRIMRGLNIKTINCTRNMFRAVKMIKLGTEKENERDATFYIMLGILNLKNAITAEFEKTPDEKGDK